MNRVFLHGFATGPEIWDEFHPDYAPRLDLSDLEEESRWLSDALEPETVLVGWSMGGLIALITAALSLENIKGLVLVSTTPRFVRCADFPAGLPPALLKNLVKKIRKEGVRAFHALALGERSFPGLADTPVEQAVKELAELERADLRELLPLIEVPTLIIHGDRDEICPPGAARYLNEHIGGSELIVLDGVGHAPMIEAPERFKEALCWINSL